MPYIPVEMIQTIKQLDLLTYLQTYEPQELVNLGRCVYSTRSHDSLKISNGKWMRWSTGEGGVSALDYLVKVRDMGFMEAVQHLCDCLRVMPALSAVHIEKPPNHRQPFVLPPKNVNNDRVTDYLAKRGLSPELIQFCIDTGKTACTKSK